MSNATYKRYINDATSALQDQLHYETLQEPLLKPTNRASNIEQTATTYVKYIRIFKKLEAAYDTLLHPQKRLVLRKTVDAVLGRLIEMKHELVDLEATDMHNYATILIDLKINPEDIEIPVPKFVTAERSKEIQERTEMLDKFNAKSVEQGDTPPATPSMKIADAVQIIQINERGRQSKLRAKHMRDIKLQAEREKDFGDKDDEVEVNNAARQIQRIYRAYRCRKKWPNVIEQESIFLGMAIPTKDYKNNPIAKAEANVARRKVVQRQFEEEYCQALITVKEKIKNVEGPDIKEGIQDNFRQWYMDYKRENGKLPEFPADKIWQQPKFVFGAPEATGTDTETAAPPPPAKETKGGKGGKDKDTKKKDDAKGKEKPDAKAKGKKIAAEPEDTSPLKDLTNYQKESIESNTAYTATWKNRDESDNFAQRHDAEIIKNDKRKEVEAEIKLEVFELLKEELKNLKLAVEKDKKGKKGKKGKGKKEKKSKKGGKGAKGKGGRKEKDLTAGRTPEDLFEELVTAGIIQKHAPVSIKDFQGDYNVTETEKVQESSLPEVRRLVTEYGILPLGFKNLSDTVPCVGSVLLYGAKGTGKTMLAKAISTEIGATFFNISPKNTAGQYVGKTNVTKMMHMVFKVARLYSPSIIYIDQAEMVFAKKVPKDDTSDPKRIKKDLLKYCKGIKGPDHIMVVGNSSKPWDADLKTMLPAFRKLIYVPKPDYGSRNLLWKEAIIRICPGALKRHVNPSVLARQSDGITTGGLFSACKMVLTERRVKLLRYRPLTNSEFINYMLSASTINKEEGKLFQEWTGRLPLSKKWIGSKYPEQDGAGGGEGGEEGKSGKKTKKKK